MDLFPAVVLCVHETSGLELVVLEPHRAVFARGAGERARPALVVLRVGVGAETLREQLPQLLRRRGPEILLVGGDDAVRAAVQSEAPGRFWGRPGVTHVGEDGSVWSSRATIGPRCIGADGETLRARLAGGIDPQVLERLVADTAAPRARYAELADEVIGFARAFRERRPTATWALLGLIALAFALQLAVGFDTPPQLLRVGALSAPAVREGEFWRLLSCTLLHGGWLHVLFNGYVLHVLGGFLERVLGSSRFVLLYVVSGLVGSIGSAATLGDQFSVGASGAVWGLLGAHALLAYRSEGLLPQAMIPGAQRAAAINLGLNVLNSFRPHVDMAAHFAGGAAGALLFLVLRRGVPKLPERPGSPAPAPAPERPWIHALALVAFAFLPLALGTAVIEGQPFALAHAPDLEPRVIPSQSIEVPLPADLPQVEEAEAGVVFGDVLRGPFLSGIYSMPLEAGYDARAELEALEEALKPPEGSQTRGGVRRFESEGRQGVWVDYGYPSGLIVERAFLFAGPRLVRVEVYRWPGLPAAPEGLARTIVSGARLMELNGS